MNAAAASAHQHTHQPASAPAPRSLNGGQQAPSGGQSGFVDLINLLLGTEQTPVALDPGMGVDGKGQSDAEQPSLPTLKTRSPQEIAAALIKSMSGRDRSVSTNAFSDRPSNKSPQRKQTDPSQNPAGLALSGAPVQIGTAAAQSISLANLPMPQTSRANEPPQIKAGASESGGNAPVAFALKLTPKESPPEEKTSAQPDITPSQPETTGQSAGSGEQDKSDNQVFPLGAESEELSAPKMRMAMETSSVRGEQMHASSLFVGSELSGSPVRSQSPVAPAAPLNSADALRKSGIDAPEQVTPTGPAQDIAVRISRAEQAVDVHVTERGGQVHVAVRTPDMGLQTSLRQDLGTLVKSLDRAGYHAEASAPLSVSSTESSSSLMNGNNSQQQESGSSSGRGWGGQQGQQQHQGQSKQTYQDWMEAMENAQ